MKLFKVFILSISISFSLYANEPFIWADDIAYKPYIYKDKDGKIKGIFKELMVEIFKRMNIPLKYNVYPWKRAQKYVEHGKADGMITIITKKRLKFIKPTNSLITEEEMIFARSDNPKINNIMKIKKISQFKDYKIISTIGAGWSKEKYIGFDMVWTTKESNAFIMLANKRADIHVSSKFMGTNHIMSLIKDKPKYEKNLKKLIICPNILTSVNYNLLIRKDSKYINIIPKFNKVLKKMKLDGSYNKILAKYLIL